MGGGWSGKTSQGSGRCLGSEEQPRFTREMARWGGKRYSRGGGGGTGLGEVSCVVQGCRSIGYGETW